MLVGEVLNSPTTGFHENQLESNLLTWTRVRAAFKNDFHVRFAANQKENVKVADRAGRRSRAMDTHL